MAEYIQHINASSPLHIQKKGAASIEQDSMVVMPERSSAPRSSNPAGNIRKQMCPNSTQLSRVHGLGFRPEIQNSYG